VGARPPLVAVNCELAFDDVVLARRIAAAVRERDGGLPGVRALGLHLDRAGRAQVSMNLVALERTGVEQACTAVRDRARAAGNDVARVELVGLLPAAELARCDPEFLAWARLGPDQTIEARLA
jgi:glutamate formiminotransferase